MALLHTLIPRPTILCFMPENVSARGSVGSVVHRFVALFGVSSAKGWRGDPSFLVSREDNSMTI